MTFFITTLLLVVVTTTFYGLRRKVVNSQLARSYGCQPAPERHAIDPIFGIDHKIQGAKLMFARNSLPTHVNWFEQYGPTFITSTLFGSVIKTIDPANIQTIFGTKAADWGIQPVRLKGMEPFCGKGFITTDGHIWERSRAFLKPSFRRPNINNFDILELAITNFMTSIPKNGESIDLHPLLNLVFSDTANHFLLGRPLISSRSEEEAGCAVDEESFVKALNHSMLSCGIRMLLGPLSFLLPRSKSVDQWNTVHRYIDYYVDKAITLQKSDSQTLDLKQKKQQNLIQGLLMQTTDRVEIRNQVIQGMLAAQDTITTLISNTLFLLSRKKEIWNRLRLEAMDFDLAYASLDTLKEQKLLQNVLHESLRLYPIFPWMEREALVDTVLPRGGGPDGNQPVFAPAGSKFSGHFHALHRRKDIYGPDADEFNPDRWISIKPNAWEFMAFGGGPRVCLGQYKALAEASYVLIRLLHAYKSIESRDDRKWTEDSKLTTRNVHGCIVALIPA